MYTESQVRKVLAACNIKVQSELESEFLLFCPFHNNYRSPAAELNKETGRLFCFACHATASLIEVVQKAMGQTIFQATRLIDSKSDGFKRVDPETIFDKPPEYVQFDLKLIERLNEACLSSHRAIAYLENRLLDLESIVIYEIGYSEKQDMIVVPMHSPDGMCVGFVGRSIEGKVFKNSDHLPRSSMVFNLHRRKFCDKIVLVESTFDAIRIEQCGYHAVASLGNSLSKKQLDLIAKTWNNIVIIPDNDDAGKIMAAKLVTHIGDRVHVANLSNVKDVGDLDTDQLTHFLSTATDPLMAFITN